MERYSLISTPNYFKVHVSFLQEQELLVAAENEEAARKMVEENVLPTTEQFQIKAVTPLSHEEKLWLLQQMQAPGDEPSGEVQDTRTLN